MSNRPKKQIAPGKYVTMDFSILSAGPTPQILCLLEATERDLWFAME
jgi:hypothetical protein